MVIGFYSENKYPIKPVNWAATKLFPIVLNFQIRISTLFHGSKKNPLKMYISGDSLHASQMWVLKNSSFV